METLEKNKQFWKEHFRQKSLDYPNEEVVRFLARNRKKYDHITLVDWGCATGRHTVLGCNFGFSVIAVDYVEDCVKQTQQKVNEHNIPNCVKYCVNSWLDIKEIDDESVELMLIWGVMMGLNEKQQQEVLKSVNRMLKHDGRAFMDFRTPNDSLYGRKIGEECSNTKLNGADIFIYPLDQIKKNIRKAGLEVDNVELCEFTESNMEIKNSWWHIEVYKK